MFLSHGGTINIENFNAYGEDAARLIRALGIDVERYSEFFDENLHASLGLRDSVFFDRESFGRDQLVVEGGETSWREFLARTPLSEAARNDIARLYETRIDYLPHLSRSEKRDYLRRITYRDFLADAAGIGPEALRFLNDAGYWAIDIDGLLAWGAATDGEAGTEGLGFAIDDGKRAYFQFPDGNASIARLLVRSLIPGVAPGSGMEDVVTARFDYGSLDRAASIRPGISRHYGQSMSTRICVWAGSRNRRGRFRTRRGAARAILLAGWPGAFRTHCDRELGRCRHGNDRGRDWRGAPSGDGTRFRIARARPVARRDPGLQAPGSVRVIPRLVEAR